MGGRGSYGRSAVGGVVIAAHVALLLVLGSRAHRERQPPATPAVMVMMDLPRPVPSPEKPKARAPEHSRARLPATHPRPLVPDTSITLPARSPAFGERPGQAIDWSREAARAAAEAQARLSEQDQRDCHPADRRGALPAHCRRAQAPPPWEPQPQRAGVSGLLPWVRIGKRCIVGLGFFGCNVDELPQANGHLLDEMQNPERLRSSVPDPLP